MADLKINRKLNLVVPLDLDDGSTIYVHSQPMEAEFLEMFEVVLAGAMQTIYSNELGLGLGPRVAMAALRDSATAMKKWEGDKGVRDLMLPEMYRLTNVVAVQDGRWQYLMWDDAKRAGLVDDDDAREVANALVFFTLVSALHKKREKKQVLEVFGQLWDAQITSSNVTEFLSSLPTSTRAETMKPRVPPSSMPS